jgi:hypothetical protein
MIDVQRLATTAGGYGQVTAELTGIDIFQRSRRIYEIAAHVFHWDNIRVRINGLPERSYSINIAVISQ